MNKRDMPLSEFLAFIWPKNMPSFKFKKRKKYRHEVGVISKTDPDLSFVLIFKSEPAAKKFEDAANQSTNKVEVFRERVELPIPTDGGYLV